MASYPAAAPYRRMTDAIPAELAERRVIARAFKALREQRDMTQPEVAHGMGISTQAYQKHESGDRRFTPDKIDRILDAIGATRDELQFERARILGRAAEPLSGLGPAAARRETRRLEIGIWGAARMGAQGPEIHGVGEPIDAWDVGQLFGPSAGSLQGVGESMGDWLRPGEMVVFDRNVYPSPNDGCVVELHTGQTLIKLYVRTDGANLFLRELKPEDRTFSVPLSEVKGVYGVTLRGRRR